MAIPRAQGRIVTNQALGAAEFAMGAALGDPGMETAGALEMMGVDPTTANAIGAMEDLLDE